jgi:radical SAM protein with 4Fe4S-binding SPASM domain
MAKSTASGLGLELILACTTNGIAPKSTIQWAVETFDHITLSWDGPPPIHDRQRSFVGGSGSAMFVEQTAACLSESHRQFTVRTTVTRQSCLFLRDIVKYFGERAVEKVVLYPVYLNHRGTVSSELVPDAGLFALWFLRARRWGKTNGMDVSFPGVRIEAEHGQFCNVLQKNLVVTSDGLLSGCFLATCVAASARDPLFIGAMQNGRAIVSRRHVQRFWDGTHRGFEQCRACFNRSHCAKGCPTVCPLIHSYWHAFDCRAERIIGNALMLERRGIDLTQAEIEKLIHNHTNATPAGGYPIWLT